MNLLARLKIAQRLSAGFAAVLALSVIVGTFSVSRLARVNDNTKDLATNWLPATRSLGEYSLDVSTIRRAEASSILSGKPDVVAAQLQRVNVQKAKAAEAWKAYASTVTSDAERAHADAIQAAQERYYAAVQADFDGVLASTGNREAVVASYEGESKTAFDALLTAIRADVEFQTNGGDSAYAESQDTYSSARWAVLGLLAAAVCVGAALAFAISRSIIRPLSRALAIAETVAAGDLTSDVQSSDADETGQLLRALGRMNASLVTIVSSVRNSSDSIATGSSQIAVGNADLSQRTEEQASNLQQTAASMEELTVTVRQNADAARAATQLASSASSAAAQGGRVVGQVVTTMEEISQSSRKIVDIIGVIDGIAFQTNILALNAAVEAARAGEQGRGFAVVAAEVRTLAQRSAEAAKEIKGLIGASVEKVESGTKLVDEAGKSMADIVTEVSRVNDLISEIGAASVEQSTGIVQVGDAMQQLDQVTQQNAALVEESAAAAESLRAQAARLAEMVAVFRIAGTAQLSKAAVVMATPAVRPAAHPHARQVATHVSARDGSASAQAHLQARKAHLETPMAQAETTNDWETF
jgi:methyl-accepting chemotaxis protein